LADVSDDKNSEVCYLQSQNGNLHSADSLNGVLDDTDISEFEPLTHDVPKDISWCTEALGSILSRLHYSMSTQFRQDTCLRQSTYGSETEGALRAFITVKWMIFVLFFLLLIATQDPYENIYTVVCGMKHFFLLPPTDNWCLKGK
jgi:jumonji domain-containing protein 7